MARHTFHMTIMESIFSLQLLQLTTMNRHLPRQRNQNNLFCHFVWEDHFGKIPLTVITRMHSSSICTRARVTLTEVFPWTETSLDRNPPVQSSPWTETPSWTETLLERDLPGQRSPWTETLIDRDPHRQRPSLERDQLFRNPPWTETSRTETPLDRRPPQTGTSLDRDPPVNRITDRCKMDLSTVLTTLFWIQGSLHLRHVTSRTVRTGLVPSVRLVRVDGAFPTNVTISTEPSSTGHCRQSIECPITSKYHQIWLPNVKTVRLLISFFYRSP